MPVSIDALLADMTLDEKLGQMCQTHGGSTDYEAMIRQGRIGSILNAVGEDMDFQGCANRFQRVAVEESRLGIPLILGRDVIHGFRTVFPIPLGQAASFSEALARRCARIAAIEASACGINWTFAPMVDLSRDARWGRIAESLGEDPLLAGRLGAAMVRGFQGDDPADPRSIAACAKHYVGYGAAESGRDYNTTLIPETELRNAYLPPFHACVKAGVATLMSAFNDLNGIPASGNQQTIRGILKQEWGFDGFVVSDWTSVTEMIAHGYCADTREAGRAAIRAGVDMEMVSTTFVDHARELLASGELEMAWIDDAVRRILRIKQRLGLFENPYVTPDRLAEICCDEHLEIAREAVAASCVLLENNGVLPLKDVKRLAVIGPLADSGKDQLGCWAFDGRGEECITPLTALRQRADLDVTFAPGLPSCRSAATEGFEAAVALAREADAVCLVLGEDALLSGEAHSRAFIGLPGAQEALVEAVAATGKPLVVIVMAGRPLTLGALPELADALIYAWHPGTMGGPALADLLFGDREPGGRLPVSFPKTVGQVPIYHNRRNTGRPPSEASHQAPVGTPLDPQAFTSTYLDVDHRPRYPFGYGLTYTSFSYGVPELAAESIATDGALAVNIEITNQGDRAGTELVQLYVRDVAASLTRPVRELKAWQHVRLAPGESRHVRLEVPAVDLGFYGPDHQFIVEPGEFRLWVAPNAHAASGDGIRFHIR